MWVFWVLLLVIFLFIYPIFEQFNNYDKATIIRKHCFVTGPAVLEIADSQSPVIMTPTSEAAKCCYRTQTLCLSDVNDESQLNSKNTNLYSELTQSDNRITWV